MTLHKWIGNIDLRPKVLHQIFNKEVKASQHIPIEYFVTPEIFATKNGELGAVIKVTGTPFDVKSADELNQLQYHFGFALKSLGDELAIYVTHHRHLQPNILDGNYPEGFANEFHTAYSKQFNSAELFINDIYITIMQKASATKVNKSIAIIERFSDKHTYKNFSEAHAKRLREFQTALANLLSSLAPYSPVLLGAKANEDGASKAEALNYLSILVNARKRDYVYPRSSISSTIAERRLFFGNNTIHFEGLYQGDDRFGAMLSIKHYASVSIPGMLDALLKTPFEFISTHSYLGIEKNQALKLINTQIKRLRSVGDAAKSQIEELEIALDDLASDRISYGFHHNTILVLSDNIKDLEEKLAKIIKIYQDQQFVVVRETMNLENTFWSQIPGNFKYIRRQAPISSNNFSCFCSLHNYYSGYIHENHLGGALMLIETPSKTPFYLNLHERASGNKNDLSRGHTLLIGPSNAGKTVMMNAIASMYKKYGIRSIFFDRNLGCEVYVRANDGIYNRLVPGETTYWNPCQIKDTPKNRQFLREFIKVLSSSDTMPLTANDYNQIAEVVERNFTLPMEKRNLSNISSFFRLDFSGMDALSRYLRLPDRMGKCGDRAYLFDNEEGRLDFNADTIGFDMTNWLSDSGASPEELLPISMYLFHRLEEHFDGRLTGLFLDEGWQWLQQPYWREKLQEYLVTLRKANVFIFLSTQLPDKLAESKLASALIQGSATNIYLANPKAQSQDYIENFKLTSREYEMIKEFNPKSRNFLIKQGNEAAIGRINFNGLDHYLSVLSGNTKSVELCEEIRREVGNDSHVWLPLFYPRVDQ